uniref:GDSL esterase/lipase n=1 Tax=Kalanchoe fedtschenkoi TaxID=63787 RepID=A0A7N0UR04_KALFE
MICDSQPKLHPRIYNHHTRRHQLCKSGFKEMAFDIIILHSHIHTLLAIFILLLTLTVSRSGSAARPSTSTTFADDRYQTNSLSKIQAVFVFGDSTVDSGNNNFLLTDFRSDFQPYGRDFAGGQPTGRFTDGRLVTDFMASYVGLKDYVPPYLDPTLSLEDLKTGVSFASAASGYDPLTAKLSNVLPISKQIEYFREYRKRMEIEIGKQEIDQIIAHSGFVISAGTNDFAVNYFLVPIRNQTYTISEYQQYLLGQLQQLIQELLAEGATKIGVVGLPPIGCLPVVITVFSEDGFAKRECVEWLSSVARSYNDMVKKELSSERYQSQGIKIVYADIYTPLNQIVRNPEKFGFEEVLRGCCGTGVAETSYLCNPDSDLCPDVSKYAFFDSVHPTEKTYSILFESVRPVIDYVVEG